MQSGSTNKSDKHQHTSSLQSVFLQPIAVIGRMVGLANQGHTTVPVPDLTQARNSATGRFRFDPRLELRKACGTSGGSRHARLLFRGLYVHLVHLERVNQRFRVR